MFGRILALIRKEFLALFRDKRSRLVVIVPPLLQLMVFSYAATFDLKHVPLAIYDEDNGPAARELIARLRGAQIFEETARLTSEEQAGPLIDARKVMLLVHIRANFSAELMRGNGGPVQVIIDGRNSNSAMIALNDVRAIVTRFNLDWAEAHHLPRPPSQLVIRAWFNPNLESRWFIVTGIVGIITLLVTLLVTALSVAREREQGTFDQLLVTPLRPVEILIGKAMPGLIIGLVESGLIVTVAVLWFRIPLVGSLLALYIGIVLFLLSAVGFGLLISSLAVTQQQGLLGAFLFMVPAILLSGFATPIANMPPLVQALTLINPMRYFMIILRGVFLEGTPMPLLLHQYWPMALIGGITLSFAAWLFRHRLY